MCRPCSKCTKGRENIRRLGLFQSDTSNYYPCQGQCLVPMAGVGGWVLACLLFDLHVKGQVGPQHCLEMGWLAESVSEARTEGPGYNEHLHLDDSL